MKSFKLLNIYIDNLSEQELLDSFINQVLLTVNIDVMMHLQKNPAFYNTVIENRKDIIIVNDSQVIRILVKLLWKYNIHKISGSDFFPAFCQYHAENEKIRIFLLGAGPGVAEKAAFIINKRIGRMIIVGTYSPPFGFERDPKEGDLIIEMINKSDATVVTVGLGAPKQELWIFSNKSRLPNVKIMMAVGATIDFEAGQKKRAPKWVSSLGLEWLHRLTTEPGRLAKRYLVDDLPFLWLILKQRIGMYK